MLRVIKGEPDWARRSQLEERARKLDEQVAVALELEKSADPDSAIQGLKQAVVAIRDFTAADPFASAHRTRHAPVDRLSLLLERRKAYAEALGVIQEWRTTFDPVQPGKAVVETLNKRAERLQSKLK